MSRRAGSSGYFFFFFRYRMIAARMTMEATASTHGQTAGPVYSSTGDIRAPALMEGSVIFPSFMVNCMICE